MLDSFWPVLRAETGLNIGLVLEGLGGSVGAELIGLWVLGICWTIAQPGRTQGTEKAP